MGPSSNFFKILMVVDGIGLAMIIGSTLMEGMEDWESTLNKNYPDNMITIFYWLSGLWLAVIGLFLVMVNAASFDTLHLIEHYGMAMITFAPVVNACGWISLSSHDPAYLISQQLFTTEFFELSGMLLLDYSYFLEGFPSVLSEVVGFLVLTMASLLDVTYEYPYLLNSSEDMFDISIEVEIRSETVHWGEAIGLWLLMFVAIGRYIEEIGCISPSQNTSSPATSHAPKSSSADISMGSGGNSSRVLEDTYPVSPSSMEKGGFSGAGSGGSGAGDISTARRLSGGLLSPSATAAGRLREKERAFREREREKQKDRDSMYPMMPKSISTGSMGGGGKIGMGGPSEFQGSHYIEKDYDE